MPIAEKMAITFDNEMRITRSLLAIIPDADWNWRPHPKSTPIGKLGDHIANLAALVPVIIADNSFDLATASPPPPSLNGTELIERWDAAIPASLAALASCSDEALLEPWTLQRAGQVMISVPRIAGVQNFVLSHLIHHRGQLSVYLRLRDVPLPSIYGPSADTPI